MHTRRCHPESLRCFEGDLNQEFGQTHLIQLIENPPLICSTNPISSMTPATIPLWSISCTLISDALMHQKYNNSTSKPAECGLNGNAQLPEFSGIQAMLL